MDSPVEILIVLVIALLLFGPSRVPKVARSLGEALHEMKRAAAGISDPPPSSTEPGAAGPDDPSPPSAAADPVGEGVVVPLVTPQTASVATDGQADA